MIRGPLPLRVWSALAAGAIGLLCVAGVLAVVAVSGSLALGAVAGLVVAAALACVAARVGARVAAYVRSLRTGAAERLAGPGVASSDRLMLLRATRGAIELAELARTLRALELRVRIADDIAERHRQAADTTAAGVGELLSGLIAAEESARGQLSAELHDTVAQSLATARRQLAEGVDASDAVQEAEEQVRAVMARTRPPALRDGDLAAAVTLLREDMAYRYGLHVKVEWPTEPYPLPLAAAITIYRFFQEALLNVIKHADVDDAHLSLRIVEDQLLATVRDAGPGFDTAKVGGGRGGRHVGLGLLRERARLAGGAIDVESRPGVGTTLTLRLPIRGGSRWPNAAPAVPVQPLSARQASAPAVPAQAASPDDAVSESSSR
jgi:signal transduction histidine kinase